MLFVFAFRLFLYALPERDWSFYQPGQGKRVRDKSQLIRLSA
jgi:hypothetical protein